MGSGRTRPNRSAGALKTVDTPQEVPRWIAAAWFFCILFAYSIVRPIREMFGAIGGTEQLANLMLWSVGAMFAAVPIYSWMFNRLSRRWLVRCVYHFFAVCLFIFSMLGWIYDQDLGWMPAAFFVWTNVFGLFATSVFWSVMVEVSSRKNAKRNFGLIAAGGTTGAIVGSLSMTVLPVFVPLPIILLVSATSLEIGLHLARMLERPNVEILAADDVGDDSSSDDSPSNDSDRLGSTAEKTRMFDGVVAIVRSPYLLAICVYLFLAQGSGTVLYFLQNEIVSTAIESNQQRTSFFASIDFGTQVLTLLIQTFLTPALLLRYGLPVTLITFPLVYFVGMPILIVAPSLWTLSIVMIASRATGYGIIVPSREILFSALPRSQQYKSKSFIDTVVMRGSDAVASQSLRVVGIGSVVMWSTAALAIVFTVIGWMLGRHAKGRR